MNLLLNAVERKLLTAEGQIMAQKFSVIQRMAKDAQSAFSEAMAEVIKGRPMRERPPVDAKVSFDESQGALVWEQPAAIPAEHEAVEEPAEQTKEQPVEV